MRARSLSVIIGLAMLFTLLNAFKPLQVDDTAYYFYARQIARHPLDPYGFEIFWYQWPDPAFEVLAPPVLPYWWSLAIRLFGDEPVLWKLWLFPFSLLLVHSLHVLCHRYARGLELTLLAMTVLSPAFLPGFNMMLDVPAAALGLFALTLFLRACGSGEPGRSTTRAYVLAACAGLSAGLAMQTKYTAGLVPAVLLLHAVIERRLRLWLLAAGVAGLVFVAWEVWVASRYGQSHFLFHFLDGDHGIKRLWDMIRSLLPLVGGVIPATALVGLGAFGLARKRIGIAITLLLSGYLLIVAIPDDKTVMMQDPRTLDTLLGLKEVVFGAFGVLGCITVLAASWRLVVENKEPRPPDSSATAPRGWVAAIRALLPYDRARRDSLFLVLWLFLEVVGFVVLGPFPATRRVLGLFVVATLIVGRLASFRCQTPDRIALVHGAAIFGILLGLGHQAVDWYDAQARRRAAEQSAQWIRRQQAQFRPEFLQVFAVSPQASIPGSLPWTGALWMGQDNKIWYVGHWSFQFYADRAGMFAVVPDRSLLHRGDWLVVPDKYLDGQVIDVDGKHTRQVTVMEMGEALPLGMRPYYEGVTALEHRRGPCVAVTIYHVETDFVPATKEE